MPLNAKIIRKNKLKMVHQAAQTDCHISNSPRICLDVLLRRLTVFYLDASNQLSQCWCNGSETFHISSSCLYSFAQIGLADFLNQILLIKIRGGANRFFGQLSFDTFLSFISIIKTLPTTREKALMFMSHVLSNSILFLS